MVTETQWSIHWIHRDAQNTYQTKRKWAIICDNFTDLVCGLLVLSLDGLNRWHFCWPVTSTGRPGTDRGLSFVTAWKERSVAAADFSPHGGGRHCKMKCVCVCVSLLDKQTPKTLKLMLGSTQEPISAQARHLPTIQKCVNHAPTGPSTVFPESSSAKAFPAIFMLCSHVYTFTCSNQFEMICILKLRLDG